MNDGIFLDLEDPDREGRFILRQSHNFDRNNPDSEPATLTGPEPAFEHNSPAFSQEPLQQGARIPVSEAGPRAVVAQSAGNFRKGKIEALMPAALHTLPLHAIRAGNEYAGPLTDDMSRSGEPARAIMRKRPSLTSARTGPDQYRFCAGASTHQKACSAKQGM